MDEAWCESAAEQPEAPPRAKKRGLSATVRLLLALSLSVATVLCKVADPDGAARLQRWVVGDGSERVQQAFFRMEEALDEGGTVGEAWSAFCQELTDASV